MWLQWFGLIIHASEFDKIKKFPQTFNFVIILLTHWEQNKMADDLQVVM